MTIKEKPRRKEKPDYSLLLKKQTNSRGKKNLMDITYLKAVSGVIDTPVL